MGERCPANGITFPLLTTVLAVEWVDLGLGALIGVGSSIVLGYVFYWLQVRRVVRQLAFRSFSWPLATRTAGNDDSELVITYRERAIPQLTRTRVALWNAGWRAVDAADVADADPLSISFRNAEILEIETVSVSRESIAFSASLVRGRCVCSFDFLDRHDGAVIDILHTGRVSGLVFRGSVKEMPEGVRDFGRLVPTVERSPRQPRNAKANVKQAVKIVLGFSLFVAYIAGTSLAGAKLGGGEEGGAWPVILTLGFWLIPVALLLLGQVWLGRSRRVPSALRGVDDQSVA